MDAGQANGAGVCESRAASQPALQPKAFEREGADKEHLPPKRAKSDDSGGEADTSSEESR